MLAFQVSISAQDLGKLKKQADVYYKNEAYKKALYYYTQYANRKALDRASRFNMAVSSYESNNLSQAQKIFSSLTQEKNFDPSAYLYLGKLAHVQNDYNAAQKLYKQYLASTKDDNNAKLEARNLIRSCNVNTENTIVICSLVKRMEDLGQQQHQWVIS